jgi:sugar phosphate isomerase/epimerase
MAPIALQLYSVREQIVPEFDKTVRRVADIGYAGVEGAGEYGESPRAAANLFRELGLSVTSMHPQPSLFEHTAQAIADAQTLGTNRIVCPWADPERFATTADIRILCDELNRVNRDIRAAGLELHYHNHWQECAEVEGKLAYRHMLDFLDPNIGFELDVYWAQTAGLDPAALVRELGKRAPLIHLKDGPATMDAAQTALGEGVVNIPAVLDAGRGTTEWWIVELDRCDTDMLEAVEKSLAYLADRGLANGK